MSFKALKVWRALKRHPGSRNRDLQVILDWTDMSVSQLLLDLERNGCAVCSGSSWQRQWWATDIRPEDKRGTHPASQAAIKPYQHFANARLAKANYARVGRRRKPDPPPKPATELERCWPMTAVTVRIGQDE